MYFPQAYEEAKRLGREIKQDIPGAEFQDPDVYTSLGTKQATANNWVVSDEKSITVTPASLAKAWDDAIASGGFRSVKPAAGSDLFKQVARHVFAQSMGTTVRR